MQISPVSSHNFSVQNTAQKQPSFSAKFLNNAVIKDVKTGKPVNVAIVELETEYRELLADLRLKFKDKFSKEEFESMVEAERAKQLENARKMVSLPYLYLNPFSDWFERKLAEQESEKYAKLYAETIHHTRPETNSVAVEILDDLITKSGEKPYTGDFEFMQALAERSVEIEDIYGRVQKRNLSEQGWEYTTSMGNYLKMVTNGEREVMPHGGYGLLDRRYGETLSYMPHHLDSTIFNDITEGDYPSRQRVLMAVEPQTNYRNLKPDTKVYAMAEIFTDRAMDAVQDMIPKDLTKEQQRMKELIEEDRLFDEKNQKFLETGAKDEELRKELNKLGEEIREKHHISWGDFYNLQDGKKKYIYDVPEHEYQKAMEAMKLPEENARPVKIWRMFSTDNSFDGAENALLDAISEKAKYCGILASMWVSSAIEHCKDFKVIAGWNGEHLFKPGLVDIKRFDVYQ